MGWPGTRQTMAAYAAKYRHAARARGLCGYCRQRSTGRFYGCVTCRWYQANWKRERRHEATA